MPKLTTRTPKYRRHPNGGAIVSIDGRTHYLGRYGTKRSRQEYDRLIREWLANGRMLASHYGPTVNELLLAFDKHAERHYQKHGKPTSEFGCMRSAMRFLKDLYGHVDACELTPQALRACQHAMIEEGLARTTINRYVNRLRHIIKWAVAEQPTLWPEESRRAFVYVLEGWRAVPALQSGRTDARETEPVAPVEWSDVEAIFPHVARQVRAMCELMWWTAARPGEIVIMRRRDVDTSEDVWWYTPASHKTEHRGRERRVALGLKAQAIVAPWLGTALDAYLFSPLDAERERNGPKWNPGKRKLRDHYTEDTFRHAVHRGCDAAWPPEETEHEADVKEWRRRHRWSPMQIRHARLTEIRKRYGLEAAQAVADHARADVTQVYAERLHDQKQRVAAECG
jgi:integrase